jgi:hypothetical protein
MTNPSTNDTNFTGFKDLDEQDRHVVGAVADALGRVCFDAMDQGADPWLVHRAIAIHAGMNCSAAALSSFSPRKTVLNFLEAIELTARECRDSLERLSPEEVEKGLKESMDAMKNARRNS